MGKKLFKFINEANVVGLLTIAAGFFSIKTQVFEKTNWPTFRGNAATVIGWALIFTGIWLLYFGFKKGIKDINKRDS